MSSLMARKCFFSEFFGAYSFFILPAILAGMQFVPALQGRSKLRCENRLTPPLLPGSALRQAQGPNPTATRSAPFQSGLGFISRKLISTIFFYEKQLEISLVRSGRQIRLKTRIGAERTRQRSFKPQSEFNFLFRDTAGFQTDLPGSGTPN